MGCASSTPMIATAGSEMLKAATHVADDAAKTAEHAVQGAAQTMGDTLHKTLDTAKETVGTAVTGIAHDLEAAYVEKTGALDEAKNNLLQKLHLGGGAGGGGGPTEAVQAAATAATATAAVVAAEPGATPTHATAHAVAANAAAAHGDGDSLKTATPEPEIETALAKYNEEKPPTPDPTIAELQALSDDVASAPAALVTATDATTAAASGAGDAVAGGDIEQVAQRRPNTTEWEQYADTLSRARRLRPHEVYGRKAKVPGIGITTGGPISLRRFGPLTGAPPLPPPPPPPPWPSKPKPKAVTHHQHLFEDDSSWSDLNYNNSSTLGSSSRSAGQRGRRGRLPYPLPRPKYALARRHQRDFSSLLNGNGFVGGGGRGGGFMAGAGGGGFGRGWRQSALPQTLQLPGRKFDYNPSRVRVASAARPLYGGNVTPPLVRRLSQAGLYGRALQSLQPLPLREMTRGIRGGGGGRLGSPLAYAGRTLPRSMNASPIRQRMLLQSKVHAAQRHHSQHQLHHHRHLSDESSSLELGFGLGHGNAGALSAHSSRSSTNNSIALRSGRSSPAPRQHASAMASNSAQSPTTTMLTTELPAPPPPSVDSRNSHAASLASHNKHDSVAITQALSYYTSMHGRRRYQSPPRLPRALPRTPSPRPLPLSAVQPRRPPLPVSPVQRSATSCRSKPPASPAMLSPLFSISRQSFHGHESHAMADKENNMSNSNKELFISDLSSVSEHRALLSPYKLRDRCEVCHNKYVIQ